MLIPRASATVVTAAELAMPADIAVVLTMPALCCYHIPTNSYVNPFSPHISGHTYQYASNVINPSLSAVILNWLMFFRPAEKHLNFLEKFFLYKNCQHTGVRPG